MVPAAAAHLLIDDAGGLCQIYLSAAYPCRTNTARRRRVPGEAPSAAEDAAAVSLRFPYAPLSRKICESDWRGGSREASDRTAQPFPTSGPARPRSPEASTAHLGQPRRARALPVGSTVQMVEGVSASMQGSVRCDNLLARIVLASGRCGSLHALPSSTRASRTSCPNPPIASGKVEPNHTANRDPPPQCDDEGTLLGLLCTGPSFWQTGSLLLRILK